MMLLKSKYIIIAVIILALAFIGGVKYFSRVRAPESTLSIPTPVTVPETPGAPISQDFTLATNVSRVSFPQGNFSDRVKLTVTPQGGFTGDVAISIEGAPSSMTAKIFQPQLSIPPSGSASTDIRFGDPDMIAPSGVYQLKIVAKSGSITKSIPFEVEVQQMVHDMKGFMPR